MLNPSIRKRTLDKITAYCVSQDIDVEEYINDVLEDAINLELYGDINDKIKTTQQAVSVNAATVNSEEKTENVIKEQNVSASAIEGKIPQKKEEVSTVEYKTQEKETPKRNKRVRTIASK